MQRFEIWLADLPAFDNSHVQHGYRPVVVVSNDSANKYSPIITVVPLTSRTKKPLPTHVLLHWSDGCRTSTALCEQILTIDKNRCRRCIGYLFDKADRAGICRALTIQLDMAS